METSRKIWNTARSFVGLSLLFFAGLEGKELFNVPFCAPAIDFDYSRIKTVSFFFPNQRDFDIDSIMTSIAGAKADVVITGKTSIVGESLSPDLTIYVFINKNAAERSWMITSHSYVNGIATKAISKNGEKFRGELTVSGNTLVLTNVENSSEVREALIQHLKGVVEKVTQSNPSKPKIFVVH